MKRNILTRVSEELYQKILADSQKEKRSVSNLIRLIIEEAYDRKD